MSRAPVIATRRAVKGSPVRTADVHWHPRKFAPRDYSGPFYPAADATIHTQRNGTNGRAVLTICVDRSPIVTHQPQGRPAPVGTPSSLPPDLVCPERMALLALCEVELDVEEDETVVRGNALASGDDAEDKACEDAIIDRLTRGDVWAWCCVRVKLTFGNFTAYSDWLGCCSYRDRGEYESPGGYYDDQVDEALRDLAGQLGLSGLE